MITMTYGTVPSFKKFKEQFDKEVDTNYFRIKNSILSKAEDWVILDGNYDPAALFNQVQLLAAMACDDGPKSDEAGSMASSILDILGFEWI